jgi:hypothetical protein
METSPMAKQYPLKKSLTTTPPKSLNDSPKQSPEDTNNSPPTKRRRLSLSAIETLPLSVQTHDNVGNETDKDIDNDDEWPGWCTVESEPAVFNELLKWIGVDNAQVEEIYSLDEDSLRAMRCHTRSSLQFNQS